MQASYRKQVPNPFFWLWLCELFYHWIGDPRVKEANIIWIGPESTVWIRNPNKDQSSEFSNPNKDKKGEFSNPNKDQKGELAIDVVLEKAAVKKSGDAWRIVMDTCLPIMHLIDTTRSIPYAIKQVEDLLGTSCAFEQAVQVTLFIYLHNL